MPRRLEVILRCKTLLTETLLRTVVEWADPIPLAR